MRRHQRAGLKHRAGVGWGCAYWGSIHRQMLTGATAVRSQQAGQCIGSEKDVADDPASEKCKGQMKEKTPF